MIRNDTKINYLEADEIFLKHRENIDQGNYRVGKVKDEILVWNPDTNVFMDYFYDDISDEWFDLSLINKDEYRDITYKINRFGEVIGPRKKLSLIYDPWGYPVYKIKGKHPKIHKLIGKMFIPNLNPSVNTVIDHIDRNKDNFSFNNLRWVSVKENANNLFRPKWTGRHIYKAYSDKEHKILVFKLTDEELYNKYKTLSYTSIKRSITASKGTYRVMSYYWVIDNLILIDYLKSINKTVEDIDDRWVMHYSGNFKVHPLGLIDARGGISPGALSSSIEFHPEWKYHKSNEKTYRVHVLVAEVFLNNNKPIQKNLVVDHINTNSLDNRIENLRICTQSENMKNKITLEKLSRKVIDKDGKVFDSISDCAAFYKKPVSLIWARLNNRLPNNGFKYYNKNKE